MTQDFTPYLKKMSEVTSIVSFIGNEILFCLAIFQVIVFLWRKYCEEKSKVDEEETCTGISNAGDSNISAVKLLCSTQIGGSEIIGINGNLKPDSDSITVTDDKTIKPPEILFEVGNSMHNRKNKKKKIYTIVEEDSPSVLMANNIVSDVVNTALEKAGKESLNESSKTGLSNDSPSNSSANDESKTTKIGTPKKANKTLNDLSNQSILDKATGILSKKVSPKKGSKKSTPQKLSVSQASPQKLSVSQASPQKLSVSQASLQKFSVSQASPQKLSASQGSPQKFSVSQASPQKVSAASPQKASPQKASPRQANLEKLDKMDSTIGDVNTSIGGSTRGPITPMSMTTTSCSPVKKTPLASNSTNNGSSSGAGAAGHQSSHSSPVKSFRGSPVKNLLVSPAKSSPGKLSPTRHIEAVSPIATVEEFNERVANGIETADIVLVVGDSPCSSTAMQLTESPMMKNQDIAVEEDEVQTEVQTNRNADLLRKTTESTKSTLRIHHLDNQIPSSQKIREDNNPGSTKQDNNPVTTGELVDAIVDDARSKTGLLDPNATAFDPTTLGGSTTNGYAWSSLPIAMPTAEHYRKRRNIKPHHARENTNSCTTTGEGSSTLKEDANTSVSTRLESVDESHMTDSTPTVWPATPTPRADYGAHYGNFRNLKYTIPAPSGTPKRSEMDAARLSSFNRLTFGPLSGSTTQGTQNAQKNVESAQSTPPSTQVKTPDSYAPSPSEPQPTADQSHQSDKEEDARKDFLGDNYYQIPGVSDRNYHQMGQADAYNQQQYDQQPRTYGFGFGAVDFSQPHQHQNYLLMGNQGILVDDGGSSQQQSVQGIIVGGGIAQQQHGMSNQNNNKNFPLTSSFAHYMNSSTLSDNHIDNSIIQNNGIDNGIVGIPTITRNGQHEEFCLNSQQQIGQQQIGGSFLNAQQQQQLQHVDPQQTILMGSQNVAAILWENQQCEELLNLIQNLCDAEKKSESRTVMCTWMSFYIRACRQLGSSTNGEIVDYLINWLKFRDTNIPASDANALFFMLGRSHEYELLVLVFKALVDQITSSFLSSEKKQDKQDKKQDLIIERKKEECEDKKNHVPPTFGETVSAVSVVPVSGPVSSCTDSAMLMDESNKDVLSGTETTTHESSLGCTIDSKGCGCAVQAAAELNSVDILREVSELIDNLVYHCKATKKLPLPVSERLYYMLASFYVKNGELGLAEEIVLKAKSEAMSNSRFYHLLLGAYSSEKNWIKVDRLIHESKQLLSAKQTFNLRVRMSTEQGNLAGMHSLLEEARKEKLQIDEYAYYHLLKGFTLKRDLHAAEALFAEMEREMSSNSSGNINNANNNANNVSNNTSSNNGLGCPVFILMFDLYFKTKNPDKALALFERVRSLKKETHAIYAQMVRNLTYACRFDEAMRILKLMNDSGCADLEIHGLLVNKLYESGRKYEAAQLLTDKRPLHSKQTRDKLPLAASSTILIRSSGHLQCLGFAFGVYELYRQQKACDSFMINSLIDSCIINHKSRKAISLYSQMRNDGISPDVVTYNTIIRAFALEKDLDAAFNILREMKMRSARVTNTNTPNGNANESKENVAPNVVTYNSLIHACVQLGQYQRGWSIVDEMESSGICPDCATYTSLISSIKQMQNDSHSSKQQVLDRAFNDVLRLQQKGDRVDGVLIRALLDACAHCGRPDLAERAFDLARDIFKLSQFEYGLLIKCYSQQRDLASALRVKKRMESENMQFNAVIFGALIDLCLKVSEDRKAEELFVEMENLSISHSIISMSLKIKMYGRLGRPEKAMETLYQIQDLGLQPGILTFNSVIDSVARTGGHHFFREILEMIQRYELNPNSCTYSIIAKGYAQSGNLEMALETFRMMEFKGFIADPVTYNSLLDGCAKDLSDTNNIINNHGGGSCGSHTNSNYNGNGKKEENFSENGQRIYSVAERVSIAERLLKEMEERRISPNPITYSILVKLYVPVCMKKAYSILETVKSRNWYGHHGGGGNEKSCSHHPLRVVYSSFIHALANNGDIVHGKRAIMQMECEGFRADGYHYSALAVAAAQQHKIPQAIEFVELAAQNYRKNPKLHKNCILSAKTFGLLLKAIERKRDYRARERLQQLLSEGIFLPSSQFNENQNANGNNTGNQNANGNRGNYNNTNAHNNNNQHSPNGSSNGNNGTNGTTHKNHSTNGNHHNSMNTSHLSNSGNKSYDNGNKSYDNGNMSYDYDRSFESDLRVTNDGIMPSTGKMVQ